MRFFRTVLLLTSCSALFACSQRGATSLPTVVSEPGSGPASVRRGPIRAGVGARLGSFVAGHLYVSTAGFSLGTAPVLRYKVTNGVPDSNPDLTYPKNLQAQFAVDSDARLYAVVVVPSGGPLSIEVFQPNSNRPARQLNPPQPYLTNFSGITGRDGYVYIAGNQSSVAGGASLCAYNFVLVYGPYARGSSPWKTCFATTYATNDNILWMTLDPQANLYVPAALQAGNGVDAYANPTTNPMLVRTLSGSSFQGTAAVADDGNGYIYVPGNKRLSNGKYEYYVATYVDSGNGNVKPIRSLRYKSAQVQGNVAVDDRYLYVAGYKGVFVYQKTAAGRALPIATLSVQGATYYDASVAVGP